MSRQITLLGGNEKAAAQSTADYGTFKDSLRAPVHRWFTYPAGFSFKMVHAKIAEYGLGRDSLIVDPFSGSGTTALACRDIGVPAIGIDAHPFVSWVAKTKTVYYSPKSIEAVWGKIYPRIKSAPEPDTGEMPDLIHRCFDRRNLKTLLKVRRVVDGLPRSKEREFFRLCLVSTLRKACTAGAGWPYIAPSKYAEKKTSDIDALAEFSLFYHTMLGDVKITQKTEAVPKIINADSRDFSSHLDGCEVDLIVTSPPYLNNYDYADRTRMEGFFMGTYRDWGDISRNVRSKLMMASTTQVSKARCDLSMPTVLEVSPSIHRKLTALIERMTAKKREKAGKKNYDMMTAGYFEDIVKTLRSIRESMARNGHMVWVLGDSAPYGVHVETDVLIGSLAKAVGFDEYRVHEIRKRGDKWKNNPQRHHVKLRESMVVIS